MMGKAIKMKKDLDVSLISSILILAVSFLLSSPFLGFNDLVKGQSNRGNSSEPSLTSYSESSIPELFDKIKSSVVQISPSSNSTNSSLLGSGFIYDKYGHILTNSHVVENASTVLVTFIDGNQYDAIVKGKDPINDIAVLELSENITETLTPIQFANSSAVRVGERVFTIGNPYGFSNTLTGGFVSQLSRILLESGAAAPYPHPNMIQTDAIINPGNSGGPLVNLQGHVIGMNTAAIDSPDGGVTGLGFAIPSKTLLNEVPVLIKNGSYAHPWLGISAFTLTSDLNEEMGLSPNFKGVLVDSLVKDGPADKAGVRGGDQFPQGDIILALDGLRINNISDLLSYIENNKTAGDRINITLQRNNEMRNIVVSLGERPLSLYTSQRITSQTPLF
jgi:S1-C subfamily serine protease